MEAQINEKKTTNPRRRELINRSKGLQKITKLTGQTVNELLIESYTDEENTEFALFWDWKKKGYKVKKGSKAFLVWGRKRKIENKDAAEDEKETKFFPVAYLFSNAQVEKLKS